MTVQIALLRAVNVGGRKVTTADLRACAAELGLANVRTLLQTGNLIFESDTLKGADLEAALEAAIKERFDLAADVIVRTRAQWDALIEANPFPDAARNDPAHLVAMPLKSAPEVGKEYALCEGIVGRETVRVAGRDLFAVYPDGIGESKLTIAVIERRLGVRGTARNWKTVLKIAAGALDS